MYITVCIYCALIWSFAVLTSASSLVTPPKSVVIVAFENEYELSCLANTLSDEGVNTILIIPSPSSTSSSSSENLYDTLIDVEIIRLKIYETDNNNDYSSKESRALKACESLLTDESVSKIMQEFLPTYTISPGLRHDACVLPWAKKFKSIPIIWTQGSEAESYTFSQSGIALPIYNGGFWSRLSSVIGLRSSLKYINVNYVNPALDLVGKYLPTEKNTIENLYMDVDLIFWGSDPILRSEVFSASQLLVEIGCHHCRGVHPVPSDLQKQLIEFRLGTIAVLLDEEYKILVKEIAEGLPQGRQGQAVVWKNKNLDNVIDEKPENLFINNEVIRQDLIGYPRTRVLLSHCEDTEILETAFHGTPVICIPRTWEESRNSLRAIDLGFSLETNGDYTTSNILSLIKMIHETSGYRENARKISTAIRDRPNPPTDRITYWLGYLARNKNEEKHLSVKYNRQINYKNLFNIDIWISIGFLIGFISGAVLPTAYIFAGKILASNNYYRPSTLINQADKTKRKYKS